MEDGSVFIKQDCVLQADSELNEFNNDAITLPDLYFTLDELNDQKIPWSTLETFLPFIKE